MRIAVVTIMFGSPWGGSEELWAAMSREAVRQGHEVRAWCYRWDMIPDQIKALSDQGVKISRRSLKSLPRWVLKHAIIADPLQSVFSWKPDIVLISQGSSFGTTRKDVACFTERLMRSEVPYVVVNQCEDTAPPPTDKVERIRAFFQRARQVLFVAEGNRHTTELRLAGSLDNARIIRNPTTVAPPSPLPWPSADTVKFACVARLALGHKGQDLLLRCMANPEWKSREWHLTFFGAGPDEAYLRSLADYLGLPMRVTFAGHQPDVLKIWAEHHMLVLPSRMEGTPLVLVEAMLCGRPCVATNVGGNAEWISDGHNGFLAEAPSENCIRAALNQAWDRRLDWKAMGAEAQMHAQRLYDPNPGATLLNILVCAAGGR